jgi:hypothetical protein
VLRVECTKCDRKGRYHVHKLIEKYGRKGNMMKWREILNAHCPKRDAHSLHERCDVACPICQRSVLGDGSVRIETDLECGARITA